jgi:hypothetical protein
LLLVACSDNNGGASTSVVAGPGSAVSATPVAAASVPGTASVGTVASMAPVSVPATAAITTTTVDPSAPAACSLLTVDELGFTAGDGTTFAEGRADEAQETAYGAHTACTWTSSEGTDATVRVSIWDQPTAFDDARAQVGAAGELDGLGDRAFSSTLASVYAVAGGHTVFVQFQDLDRDDATNLAATTGLAQLVASRL